MRRRDIKEWPGFMKREGDGAEALSDRDLSSRLLPTSEPPEDGMGARGGRRTVAEERGGEKAVCFSISRVSRDKVVKFDWHGPEANRAGLWQGPAGGRHGSSHHRNDNTRNTSSRPRGSLMFGLCRSASMLPDHRITTSKRKHRDPGREEWTVNHHPLRSGSTLCGNAVAGWSRTLCAEANQAGVVAALGAFWSRCARRLDLVEAGVGTFSRTRQMVCLGIQNLSVGSAARGPPA